MTRVGKKVPPASGPRVPPAPWCAPSGKTPDIWLRRVVELPAVQGDVALWIHHDEEAEVYINGILVAKAQGFTVTYEELLLDAKGREAIRPGKNLLAVHCKQTRGGQYIDLGLVELIEPAEKP